MLKNMLLKRHLLTTAAVLIGLVAAPASATQTLTGITVGAITNYNTLNSGVHSVASDTWYTTWASDGNTYSISDDNSNGWDGLMPGAGHGYAASIALLSGTISPTSTAIIGSLENPMTILGISGQNGGTEQPGAPQSGATWKGWGLMSISGTLYGMFSRQPEYSSATQVLFDEYTGSIISCQISSDCTQATSWAVLPTTTAADVASPTWPMPSTPRVAFDGKHLGLFTTPGWVQYGQDYNNATGTLGGFPLNVDGNTTYAYAFGSDGYSTNSDNEYLGRVPIAGGASQIKDPTQWQYYCGPVGGSISNNANWCGPSVMASYPSTATALFHEPGKLGAVSVQYLPVHGRYIAIFTYFPASNVAGATAPRPKISAWGVYEAGTLTGPWTKVQTMYWSDQTGTGQLAGFYFPTVLQQSLDTDGGLTGMVLAAGNYSFQGAGSPYTMNFFPITFNYSP
jgi:hypothetical protein